MPESFEWLILKADLLNDKEIRDILNHPEEFIDSKKYFSWEQFFTALLTEKSKDTYLKYSKSKLNPAFLQKHEKDNIFKNIPKIE